MMTDGVAVVRQRHGAKSDDEAIKSSPRKHVTSNQTPRSMRAMSSPNLDDAVKTLAAKAILRSATTSPSTATSNACADAKPGSPDYQQGNAQGGDDASKASGGSDCDGEKMERGRHRRKVHSSGGLRRHRDADKDKDKDRERERERNGSAPQPPSLPASSSAGGSAVSANSGAVAVSAASNASTTLGAPPQHRSRSHSHSPPPSPPQNPVSTVVSPTQTPTSQALPPTLSLSATPPLQPKIPSPRPSCEPLQPHLPEQTAASVVSSIQSASPCPENPCDSLSTYGEVSKNISTQNATTQEHLSDTPVSCAQPGECLLPSECQNLLPSDSKSNTEESSISNESQMICPESIEPITPRLDNVPDLESEEIPLNCDPPTACQISGSTSSTTNRSSLYKAIKPIGKGSHGSVTLCARVSDKRLVVVKKIDLTDMSEEERESARKEVAPIMKVLKKMTLYILSWSMLLTILLWFFQLAHALDYIHDKNILHRDLKTQNIFLSKDLRVVKIGDFGISKMLSSPNQFAKTIIGTPYYLSPEMCEDKPYNQKSDVWALGCIIYELSTLRHAFDGKSLPALVLKILRGIYPPIPTTYSSDLKSLISNLLLRDPQLRPSISEVVSTMKAIFPNFDTDAQRQPRLKFVAPFISHFSHFISSISTLIGKAAEQTNRLIPRYAASTVSSRGNSRPIRPPTKFVMYVSRPHCDINTFRKKTSLLSDQHTYNNNGNPASVVPQTARGSRPDTRTNEGVKPDASFMSPRGKRSSRESASIIIPPKSPRKDIAHSKPEINSKGSHVSSALYRRSSLCPQSSCQIKPKLSPRGSLTPREALSPKSRFLGIKSDPKKGVVSGNLTPRGTRSDAIASRVNTNNSLACKEALAIAKSRSTERENSARLHAENFHKTLKNTKSKISLSNQPFVHSHGDEQQGKLFQSVFEKPQSAELESFVVNTVESGESFPQMKSTSSSQSSSPKMASGTTPKLNDTVLSSDHSTQPQKSYNVRDGYHFLSSDGPAINQDSNDCEAIDTSEGIFYDDCTGRSVCTRVATKEMPSPARNSPLSDSGTREDAFQAEETTDTPSDDQNTSTDTSANKFSNPPPLCSVPQMWQSRVDTTRSSGTETAARAAPPATLGVRAESLRLQLENELGEDVFMEAYKTLHSLEHTDTTKAHKIVEEKLRKLIPPDKFHFVGMIESLLVFEDCLFG
ncbi:protein kinase [Pelomyxa schiedti]|nr:protein kinase [Pelomyxa schiedti]